MTCRCDDLIELIGAEAAEYAQHLTRVTVNNETWEVEYVVPDWMAVDGDVPQQRGAWWGSPLLRRLPSND